MATLYLSLEYSQISHLFYQGEGMYFQFLESEILIQTLLRLKDKGILALPIHDCILVPKSAVDCSLDVFYNVFKENVSTAPKLVVTNL